MTNLFWRCMTFVPSCANSGVGDDDFWVHSYSNTSAVAAARVALLLAKLPDLTHLNLSGCMISQGAKIGY